MTIAFLGDSITAAGDWRSWFPQRQTRNFGIPGDSTQDLLNRLDDCIAVSPDRVYLLIGTNDFGNEDRSVEQVVANTELILARLRGALPSADIVVQSVMPRGSDYAERIRALNTAYEMLAARYRARYLDLWPVLARADGELLPELSDDRLHLLPSGYQRWLEILAPDVEADQAAPGGEAVLRHA